MLCGRHLSRASLLKLAPAEVRQMLRRLQHCQARERRGAQYDAQNAAYTWPDVCGEPRRSEDSRHVQFAGRLKTYCVHSA